MQTVTKQHRGLPFLRQLARKHLEVGVTLGHPSFANVGRLKDGLAQLQEGAQLADSIYESQQRSIEAGFIVIPQRRFLGDLLTAAGRLDEAEASYHRVVLLAEEWLRTDPSNQAAVDARQTARSKLAWIDSLRGRHQEAVTLMRQVQAETERLLTADHSNDLSLRNTLVGRHRLARILLRAGEAKGALELAKSAAVQARARNDARTDGLRAGDAADMANTYASVLRHMGRHSEALEWIEVGVVALRPMLEAFPRDSRYQSTAAELAIERGRTLASTGRGAEARVEFARGEDSLRSLAARDPFNADYKRALEEATAARSRFVAGR